jgi:signal transduction histidine kinase
MKRPDPLKRLTIRARLTLVYGGLFVLGGIVLLGVTYVLVAARLPAPLSKLPPGEKFVERLPGEAINPAIRTTIIRYSEDIREGTLDSLLTQGGIALVLVTAVAIGFGWLLAGKALQPLHQITETAHRIAAAGPAGRGLHERIALTGPRDEIRLLADTFDAMLERLDRSFDGQRRLVASASHELRTPLAINRALLELAVTRPDASADLRLLATSLLEVNERHERLVDGLLTLADSENVITDRSPVDLAEVADHVADMAGPVAGKAGIEIVRQLAPAATVGDPILLERLTFNLVENGIRHNEGDGGWLSVRTATVDGRATLYVSNTGPVVPGYEVETLFQPFRRLGRERVGGGRGFGLGLSIVRAVARAHRGDATAAPRDGGGLVVTVSLPGQTDALSTADPGFPQASARLSTAVEESYPQPWHAIGA